jgi:hypothetical protein
MILLKKSTTPETYEIIMNTLMRPIALSIIPSNLPTQSGFFDQPDEAQNTSSIFAKPTKQEVR